MHTLVRLSGLSFLFFLVACGDAGGPSSEPTAAGTGTGTGAGAGNATGTGGSAEIKTAPTNQAVSAFTCTGTSSVPNHAGYTYHFTYDGNASGTLDESNGNGTTSLASSMHCTIATSSPPPGPGGGTFTPAVNGLTCKSWGSGPATGYQVDIHIDAGSTHQDGTLRICIDDNLPTLADLVTDGTITTFSCDGVKVTQ